MRNILATILLVVMLFLLPVPEIIIN